MKIAFIYTIPVSYRQPLFKILSKKYILKLYFTRVDELKKREKVIGTRILSNISIPLMNRYSEDDYGSPEIPYTLFYYLLHDEYDIIIAKNLNSVSTYIAFLASRIRRKPLIVWEETWYKPTSGLLRKIIFLPSLKMLKVSDSLIVSGSRARDFYLSLGFNKNKIFVAPNASHFYEEVNKIESKKILKKYNLEGKKIILYLGRLIERKGIKYLIEAFKLIQKNHKNFALLIAGTGNEEVKLQKYCDSLDLHNVLFLGYVSEKVKHNLYSIADVFVLPSIKTEGLAEVWGMTVNEAMSSGTPVICTEAVGAAYDLIVDGFNGYIVKERDSEALTQAILKTIIDNQIATKMGLRSKEIVKARFTYKDMAEGFFKAIDFVFRHRR